MEKVGPERRMIVKARGQGLCSGAGAEKDGKKQPEHTGIASPESPGAALAKLRTDESVAFQSSNPCTGV